MKSKKNMMNILCLFTLLSIILSNVSLANSSNIYVLNVNTPPIKPCNINPNNGSINQPINITLIVCCSDPDNDTMNVSFYNAQGDTLIGIHYNVSSGFPGMMQWTNLNYNTTYEWYAIANDSEFENQSDTWNFKTIPYTGENRPPNIPSNPSPANGSVNVSLNPDLSVSVSDPDGDVLDVSFYDASDDSLIAVDYNVASGSVASITWNGLSKNTSYYWYVIVDDSEDTIKSNTWNFKTINIKLKIDINGVIGVNAFISNIGDDDAYDVEWNMSIQGPLRFIDESIGGNIDEIKENDDVIAKKLLVFGLGFVDITVSANCDYADEVEESEKAILIGYFIFIY